MILAAGLFVTILVIGYLWNAGETKVPRSRVKATRSDSPWTFYTYLIVWSLAGVALSIVGQIAYSPRSAESLRPVFNLITTIPLILVGLMGMAGWREEPGIFWLPSTIRPLVQLVACGVLTMYGFYRTLLAF